MEREQYRGQDGRIIVVNGGMNEIIMRPYTTEQAGTIADLAFEAGRIIGERQKPPKTDYVDKLIKACNEFPDVLGNTAAKLKGIKRDGLDVTEGLDTNPG